MTQALWTQYVRTYIRIYSASCIINYYYTDVNSQSYIVE